MNHSNEHDDWLDADLAERLLDGKDISDADADDRVADVARVLAAAVQPLATDPLLEPSVLAAFRTAGRPSREGWWWTRRSRAAKAVLCGAAATLAFTGVAIAAQNGELFSSGSTPEPGPSSSSSSPEGVSPAAPGSPAPGADPFTGIPQSSPHATPPRAPHPVTTPTILRTAEIRGLCEAYQKTAGHGQTVKPSLQGRLEGAAGGPDKVAAYCANVTEQDEGHSTSPATAASPGRPAAKAVSPSASVHRSSPSSPPANLARPAAPPTNGRRHH